MTFCANNCTHPGPFVRDGEFMLCRSCVGEPAREKRGPERAYEPQSFLGTRDAKVAGRAHSWKGQQHSTKQPKPDGWVVVRVPLSDPETGRPRTNRDAYALLKETHLRGVPLHFIGFHDEHFLFAHPPHVELKSDTDPLVAIEQFRSKP